MRERRSVRGECPTGDRAWRRNLDERSFAWAAVGSCTNCDHPAIYLRIGPRSYSIQRWSLTTVEEFFRRERIAYFPTRQIDKFGLVLVDLCDHSSTFKRALVGFCYHQLYFPAPVVRSGHYCEVMDCFIA